jgi:hypothetical protein
MIKSWRAVFHDPRISELESLKIDVAKGPDTSTAADIIFIPSNVFGEIPRKYIDEFGAKIQQEINDYITNKCSGYLSIGKVIFVNMAKYSQAYRLAAIVATTVAVETHHPAAYPLADYTAFKAFLDAIQTYNNHKPTKIRSVCCPALSTEVPFRSAFQIRVAIDGYLCLGFVGRTLKQRKELQTLMITVSRPCNIRTLYP